MNKQLRNAPRFSVKHVGILAIVVMTFVGVLAQFSSASASSPVVYDVEASAVGLPSTTVGPPPASVPDVNNELCQASTETCILSSVRFKANPGGASNANLKVDIRIYRQSDDAQVGSGSIDIAPAMYDAEMTYRHYLPAGSAGKYYFRLRARDLANAVLGPWSAPTEPIFYL